MKENELFTLYDAIISGDVSGAIERSEKQGQNEVVQKQMLPIKSNPFDKFITKAQYIIMGIEILDVCDGLFYNVKLPKGWTVKPTDHSMWNKLIDDKNRERASFFYKAAFYDRDAFINFNCRYTYEIMPFDEYKGNSVSYEDRMKNEWFGVIRDCKTEIWRTKGLILNDYYKDEEKLKSQCLSYLNKNFPDFKNINAYWD